MASIHARGGGAASAIFLSTTVQFPIKETAIDGDENAQDPKEKQRLVMA
jgi:hypothetical protein